MKALRSEEFEAFSAGISTHGLNPYAVQVMEEIGIDMSQARSKTLEEIPIDDIDICITVCDHAKESCPILPRKITMIHHSFKDPPTETKNNTDENKKLKVYREVRNQIKQLVLDLNIK